MTRPPPPAFYLTVGEAVTCLTFTSSHLVVGTALGNIKIYCCKSWQLVTSIETFSKGVLWLSIVEEGRETKIICQGRFEGVKIIKWNQCFFSEGKTIIPRLQHTIRLVNTHSSEIRILCFIK